MFPLVLYLVSIILHIRTCTSASASITPSTLYTQTDLQDRINENENLNHLSDNSQIAEIDALKSGGLVTSPNHQGSIEYSGDTSTTHGDQPSATTLRAQLAGVFDAEERSEFVVGEKFDVQVESSEKSEVNATGDSISPRNEGQDKLILTDSDHVEHREDGKISVLSNELKDFSDQKLSDHPHVSVEDVNRGERESEAVRYRGKRRSARHTSLSEYERQEYCMRSCMLQQRGNLLKYKRSATVKNQQHRQTGDEPTVIQQRDNKNKSYAEEDRNILSRAPVKQQQQQRQPQKRRLNQRVQQHKERLDGATSQSIGRLTRDIKHENFKRKGNHGRKQKIRNRRSPSSERTSGRTLLEKRGKNENIDREEMGYDSLSDGEGLDVELTEKRANKGRRWFGYEPRILPYHEMTDRVDDTYNTGSHRGRTVGGTARHRSETMGNTGSVRSGTVGDAIYALLLLQEDYDEDFADDSEILDPDDALLDIFRSILRDREEPEEDPYPADISSDYEITDPGVTEDLEADERGNKEVFHSFTAPRMEGADELSSVKRSSVSWLFKVTVTVCKDKLSTCLRNRRISGPHSFQQWLKRQQRQPLQQQRTDWQNKHTRT